MITTPKIIKKNKKDLLPAPYNPRVDIKKDSTFYQKLYASLVNFGYVEPIIWNKKTGFVVGGNQRLSVLMDIDEIQELDVVEVNLTLEKEKALNLALNKINGEWDYDLLAEVLSDLQKEDDLIDFTGFDEKEINEIINNFNLKEPGEEDYDVDEALQKPPKYVVKPGDVYQLSNHYVMCGDSTKKEDVEKLMNGEKAQLVITDPPYNVNYSSKNELLNLYDKGNAVQTPLKNHFLTEQEYLKFTELWMNTTLDVLDDYNSVYVFGNYESLDKIMLDKRLIVSNILVWVKNSIILGRMDYKCQHEFLLYGWKKHHKWYGKNNKSTVFSFNKPLANKLHPTMKPIELLIELIYNSSKLKHIVYDPFGGSGSTLIACEQTNRNCYMMEIDCAYISVIIDRYINFKNSDKDVYRLNKDKTKTHISKI